MISRYILLGVFFITHSFAFSQQGINRDYKPYNHIWTAIDIEQNINDKVSVDIDIPYRRQSLEKESLKIYEHLHYYGFRLWLNIQLSDEVKMSLSPLACFYEIPPTYMHSELDHWQDELRFTLQVRYASEGSSLSHRYSLERRYRRDYEDEHWQEYRVRYRLRYNREIFRKFSLIAEDELFINMGKDIAYNIFDMNRLFVGFSKEVHSNFLVTAGYQNVLDLLSSGETFNLIHVLSVSVNIKNILGD